MRSRALALVKFGAAVGQVLAAEDASARIRSASGQAQSTGLTARPSARSLRGDSRAASGRLLEAARSSKRDPDGTEAGGLERSLSVTGNFGAGSGSGALMKGTGSQQTPRWREMDSNFQYRSAKAADFRSIPGCAAASASRRRYNSYIPSQFVGLTSNSLNAQTKASTRSGEYPAAARSLLPTEPGAFVFANDLLEKCRRQASSSSASSLRVHPFGAATGRAKATPPSAAISARILRAELFGPGAIAPIVSERVGFARRHRADQPSNSAEQGHGADLLAEDAGALARKRSANRRDFGR